MDVKKSQRVPLLHFSALWHCSKISFFWIFWKIFHVPKGCLLQFFFIFCNQLEFHKARRVPHFQFWALDMAPTWAVPGLFPPTPPPMKFKDIPSTSVNSIFNQPETLKIIYLSLPTWINLFLLLSINFITSLSLSLLKLQLLIYLPSLKPVVENIKHPFTISHFPIILLSTIYNLLIIYNLHEFNPFYSLYCIISLY